MTRFSRAFGLIQGAVSIIGKGRPPEIVLTATKVLVWTLPLTLCCALRGYPSTDVTIFATTLDAPDAHTI